MLDKIDDGKNKIPNLNEVYFKLAATTTGKCDAWRQEFNQRFKNM